MPQCPNCLVEIAHHPDNGCVLQAFASVVRDRENLTDRKIRQLMRDCDVDALWDDLGPILDRFEEGFYTVEEES